MVGGPDYRAHEESSVGRYPLGSEPGSGMLLPGAALRTECHEMLIPGTRTPTARWPQHVAGQIAASATHGRVATNRPYAALKRF